MSSPAAADEVGVRQASSTIFDGITARNDLEICRVAEQMDDAARYAFLLKWVLPSETHSDLRINGRLTPGVPSLAEPATQTDQTPRQRHKVGGRLVAPALQLLRAARKLGQLEDLQQRLQHYAPEGEVQQRARLTMLAATLMAAGQQEQAGVLVDDLSARLSKQQFRDLDSRWSELIFIAAAFEYRMLLHECHEFLVTMLSQARHGVSFETGHSCAIDRNAAMSCFA